MGENTKIEWTDATWQVVTGCSPMSAGCKNCYAARLASGRLKNHLHYKGLAVNGKWTGEVRCNHDVLDQPLHWREPRNIFVASMGDLFHPDVPLSFIRKVFDVIAKTPRHQYQILTKRPKRLSAYRMSQNMWRGTSAENQEMVDQRVPYIVKEEQTFVSLEPLLGPVNLSEYIADIDGVIVGGESGPYARPMHPDWVRSIRDQCLDAGVSFFFKQWGEWMQLPPFFYTYKFGGCNTYNNRMLKRYVRQNNASRVVIARSDGWQPDELERNAASLGESSLGRVGKKKAGRLLDGREWNETPWFPYRM